MSLRLTLTEPPALPADLAAAMAFGERQVLRIGRQADLDWVLPDPTLAVSGQHCEIRRDPFGYTLHDLSTNGTFLNGEAKRIGEARSLANGDRIAVGPYVMAVELVIPVQDNDETVVLTPRRSPSLAICVVEVPNGAPAYSAEAALGDEGNLVIGRDAKADLMLPDATSLVSRRHCEIRAENGSYVLHELSTNGTFRAEGGERIPSGMALQNGDRLRIGGFVLQATIKNSATKAVRETLPIRNETAPAAVLPRRGAEPGTVIPPAAPSSGTNVPANGTHETAELTAILRPPPAKAPRPSAPSTTESAAAPAGSLIERVAKALGLPAAEIVETDPAALAEQLAMMVAISVTELKLLLATNQRRMGSSQVANPIEALPNAEEAMRIMFGQPRRSYLDARRAVRESFITLREEQSRTPAAMGEAATAFAESLSPDAVEKTVGSGGALGKLVGKRKTKLWDHYKARWTKLTGDTPDGAAEAFKRLFVEKLGRG